MKSCKRQEGTILIITLVFMLLITLLGVGSMQSSNLNLLMASNEQARIEAVEKAEGVIDNILSLESNIKVTGGVGYTMCAQGNTSSDCNESNIVASVNLVDGETLTYRAVRKGPESASAPVMDETMASSASAFKVALFEVEAEYDGTSVRQGYSSIAQGLMQLIPNSEQ